MQKSDSEFAAFVGIDWAERKHDVCSRQQGATSWSCPFCASTDLHRGVGTRGFASASTVARSPSVWSSPGARRLRASRA